jgi:hypothetical protein
MDGEGARLNGRSRNMRLFAIHVKVWRGGTHRGPRMDAHKFRIGQHVYYKGAPGAPSGVYVVLALLPQREDGEFEYRIKHSHEPHQRNAKESELRPASRGI